MDRATCLRRWFLAVVAAVALAAPSSVLAQDQPDRSQPEGRSRNPSEMAQQWLLNRFRGQRKADKYERRHPAVVSTFREVVSDPGKSTVEVMSDYESVALGAVVSANGFILTKASDLKGKIICKMRDSRRYEAEIVGTDKQYDLALLKIDADGLTPVVWTDLAETPVGSWLATPGLQDDPISIGVLSAAPRTIAAPRPILGVLLGQSDLGSRIDEVMPNSGAQAAELKIGDIIVGVNDEDYKTRESLIQRIGQFQSGDIVRLKVRRGEEELKVEATLGPLEGDDEMNRHAFQNQLGGALSKRRAGFPSVFQHDTILQPNECGGPIVDLDGHAVGVNIARAGRVASYAVPASAVKQVLATLMGAKPVSVEKMN